MIDPIEVIKRHYYSCLNVEDHRCATEWKHDECYVLRKILFEITGDSIYDEGS